jgi:hypothetical protein
MDVRSSLAFPALSLLIVAAALACGGSTNPASGGPSDASSGGTTNACTMAVDAVIARGCTRCWPAYRSLCTQGNAAAVQGLLACLTNSVCWDIGDPNTALPCMQQVVDANITPEVQAIQSKLTSLGCLDGGAGQATEFESYLVMMSAADQTKYAACIASVSSCSDPRLDSCLSAGTAFNQSLCMN